MHERGVVKRDTLHRRRKCTEHGYGNRDQSRLLRKVEVRDMCGWYLEYRFGTQMHRRGARNGYPFRAKCDTGTKTHALIQGMCFWLMLGNERIC
jgi:hypothetical protein